MFPELAAAGFVRLEVTGKIKWRKNRDKNLYKFVAKQGRPFILAARFSSSSGAMSYTMAAKDAHGAARALFRRTGMDVRHLLPPISELAEMLRTRSRVETNRTPDGSGFTNRFLLLELAGTGVLLSLSVGSGSKVSEEDLEQPHPAALVRLIRGLELPVAGIFAKRTDRYCRTEHGHTKLYDWLKSIHRKHGVWAGDGYLGRWDFEDPVMPIRLQMATSFAAADVEMMMGKFDDQKAKLTKSRMKGAKVRFAASGQIPPGLMLYRDEKKRQLLAIDTPKNYPADSSARGLPQVFDAQGGRVDQTALIRDMIARWGVDDENPCTMFEEFAARGLSTQPLRARNKSHTHYLSDSHKRSVSNASVAHGFLVTMRRHLNLYQKGELSVKLAGKKRVIKNCFPPDGPWGTPEDFARIRAYEKARKENNPRRASRWAKSGWQGFAVTLDGEEAAMRGRDRATAAKAKRGPGVDWFIDRAAKDALEKAPLVPEELIYESVIAGLRVCDDSLLAEFEGNVPDGDADGEARREEVIKRLADIAAERRNMADRLIELHGASDELREEVLQRDRVLKKQKERLDSELRELDFQRAVVRHQVGMKAPDLDTLVAALRGQRPAGLKNVLRKGVHNLSFVRQRAFGAPDAADAQRPGWARDEIRWSGDLVIDDERLPGGRWKVPFEGSFRPQEQRVDCLEDFMRRVRRGEISRNAKFGNVLRMRHQLAAAVGLSCREIQPISCGDSDLVRAWAAVQFPDPIAGEALEDVITVEDLLSDPTFTEQFGGIEPARVLLTHMRSLLGEGDSGGWLRPTSETTVRFVVCSVLQDRGEAPAPSPKRSGTFRHRLSQTGHTHNWTFASGRWPSLVPCKHCGGSWRVPTRLREISGYLCLNPSCRKDEAGVRWPERFDAYLASIDLLAQAGVEVHVPAGFDGMWKLPDTSTAMRAGGRGFWRPAADLNEDEVAALLSAYVTGERVGDIEARFRILERDIYALVSAAGVAPRHKIRRPRTQDCGDVA